MGGPKESAENLGGPKECFFILKINATKQVFTPPLCQDFENKIKFPNLFSLLKPGRSTSAAKIKDYCSLVMKIRGMWKIKNERKSI